MVYEERTYRKIYNEKDLHHFQIIVEETDLDIAIKQGCYNQRIYDLALSAVLKLRQELKDYIKKDPVFLTALKPHLPMKFAPRSIVEMCEETKKAGVGPMAAVAGLFAERVGRILSSYSPDVIVENGGDIWLRASNIKQVGIYAGKSPFTAKVALEISSADTPLGICTSSATVGHSLSFGKADAVIILSPSAVLSDAAATAVCNMIQGVEDLEKAVDYALRIAGVSGAVTILGDKMAAKGRIKLVSQE